MGSVEDAFGHAFAEAFFATLEDGGADAAHERDPAGERLALFEFIGGFHNFPRRHSALGYVSAAEFERATVAAAWCRPSSRFDRRW